MLSLVIPAASVFEISCENKQTDTQTNDGKTLPGGLPPAWIVFVGHIPVAMTTYLADNHKACPGAYGRWDTSAAESGNQAPPVDFRREMLQSPAPAAV